MNQLKNQLRTADAQNEPPPAPLDLTAVKALLPALDALLNQEIPAAAEAIRALTGPITIRQEQVPGKTRGAKWIATFSPDLLAWLRQTAKDKDCPDSVTLEFLGQRIWIMPEKVEVLVDHVPIHEEIAGKAAELAAKGASVEAIARVLGKNWQTIKDALTCADTDRPPTTKPSGRGTMTRSGPLKYQSLAEDVVRLHEQKKWSFQRIARHLGVGYGTVTRAYDLLRPDAIKEAAATDKRPRRGNYRHLPNETFEMIESMLRAGRSPKEIAEVVGCGVNTVRRERHRLGLGEKT